MQLSNTCASFKRFLVRSGAKPLGKRPASYFNISPSTGSWPNGTPSNGSVPNQRTFPSGSSIFISNAHGWLVGRWTTTTVPFARILSQSDIRPSMPIQTHPGVDGLKSHSRSTGKRASRIAVIQRSAWTFWHIGESSFCLHLSTGSQISRSPLRLLTRSAYG